MKTKTKIKRMGQKLKTKVFARPLKSAKKKVFKTVSCHKKKTAFGAIVFLLGIIGIYLYIQDQRAKIPQTCEVESLEKAYFEKDLKEMVKGSPIEDMIPYITQKDKIVAAFLVGIAKKESAWGKRTPKLKGKECYNYWGYRGGGKEVAPGGYTCFKTPEEAVDVVGSRIEKLVYEHGRETPQKMIVWKCGGSCAGHSAYGVRKWISDVNIYFEKILKM